MSQGTDRDFTDVTLVLSALVFVFVFCCVKPITAKDGSSCLRCQNLCFCLYLCLYLCSVVQRVKAGR